MDWSYSPHREAGGTLHLPSPSHSSHYDAVAIQKLRRSLSRSPSKPTRIQLAGSRSSSGSPSNQLSPLDIVRAVSPILAKENQNFAAWSPSTETRSSQKPKFALRRVAPFRSSPRINPACRSPMRRVLGDNSSQGNIAPDSSRRSSGDENDSASDKSPGRESDAKTPAGRPEHTVLFDFGQPNPQHLSTMTEHFTPIKSSPLKRVDGRINLDQPNFGTPAKRRSLHGSSSAADFDIFSQNITSHFDSESAKPPEQEYLEPLFPSPAPRRSTSLRKSSHQRHTPAPSRQRSCLDHAAESFTPVPTTQKPRQRMSLDSTYYVAQQQESPFMKSTMRPPPAITFGPRASFSRQPPQHPHPLSNALTASSSGSSLTDSSPSESYQSAPMAPKATRYQHSFAKSLPLGVGRPTESFSSQESSFETPDLYKFARPNPNTFMSTGVISKRNRNLDSSNEPVYQMPDTPSKRASFPPGTGSPFPSSAFKKISRPKLDFGVPTSPFVGNAHTPLTFPSISNPGLTRKHSFLSNDGDSLSRSPSFPQDSQSSADELPPTPTKPAGKEKKENSLRSSLFGRRPSLNPDTFAPPGAVDVPRVVIDTRPSTVGAKDDDGISPHTPIDSFTPPDPSGLSISAGQHRWAVSLNSSTLSNGSFPPATPTAQRDYQFPFASTDMAVNVHGVTNNDVDGSLTARFNNVQLYGNGEFSQVFRVDGLIDNPLAPSHAPERSGVWAVKKAKKPFGGQKDREQKYREVQVLKALKENDHIIGFVDCWEWKGHLYIQTEFCEDGNLRNFYIRHGAKGRLDDFRIWKILLELSLGVKYIHESGFIHLDLKPANVFIDFEGVLKIGDFGLASVWPAPPHIEGEGDREYMAPEVLNGRFDKPADVYALGIMILEIAANMELPSYGEGWQRLRHGNLANIPSLTFSSASTISRTKEGDPISPSKHFSSDDTHPGSDDSAFSEPSPSPRAHDLVVPPNFMIDAEDARALDSVVCMMIQENPDHRPTIQDVYNFEGVQWVEKRRRAGATIYEGPWGPEDEFLDIDVDMTDV